MLCSQVRKGKPAKQVIPSDHATVLANYYEADEETIKEAIQGSLKAKQQWEELPWSDR
jgi:1-pyrroline-5-carboxylate dehydrogenase